LKLHFGDNYTDQYSQFQKWLQEDMSDFTPYGKLVHSFSKKDSSAKTYKIYMVKVMDQRFLGEQHHTLQAIFYFFIERASFIEITDSWSYFLLYECTQPSEGKEIYKLCAFTTMFEFDENNEHHARISQFLVLPAYQRQGFAQTMVRTIYNYYIEHNS